MRRYCLISVLFIIVSILLFQMGCQEQSEIKSESKAELTAPESGINMEQWTEITPDVDKAGPSIKLQTLVHDFGEVGPGTQNSCVFKFTNTGDSLLKITEIKGCCGATTKLDKREYEPGESGALEVKYRSRSQASLINQQIRIMSNDKTRPTVALTLKGKIVPRVDFEPKRLQFLLKEENNSYPNIILKSLDDKQFSIRGFQATGNSIIFDYDPSVEGTKFILQPKVDTTKLQKRLNGVIKIDITHPESKSVIIPYSALPEFEINPPQIIAFNAEPGKPIKRKIWVINNYKKHFEVESASSQMGIIKVLSQEKIGKGYQFMLEIMPPPADGKAKFADVFNVNIKDSQKLTVMCRGFYLKKK